MAARARRSGAAAAASVFDSWTLEDARRALASLADTDLETNRKFFDGDHWQDSEGWIGPHPKEIEAGYTIVMEEIKRAFVSRNVIKEVVRRHAEACIGLEPEWKLTPLRPMQDDAAPSKEEEALIDEVEALLTEWWDKRRILETLQQIVYNLLWASRSTGRLFIPSGLLPTETKQDDGAPEPGAPTARLASAGDVATALELLYFEAPMPDVAGVYEDPDSKQQCGIFWYRRDQTVSDITGRKLRNPRELEYAELTYLENGNTVMRTLGKTTDDGFVKDFGGRLNVFQIERDKLITEQVRQGQRALNLALTMVPRNVTTGGFLERTMLNAQMPGEIVKDPNDPSGQREYFKPDEQRIGAGTTTWVRGIAITDAQGNENLTTPNINYREPIDPTPSIVAKKSHYEDILGEVDQVHILIQGEATASGVSREQARADFERSLRSTLTGISALGRWLIETALAMAEQLSNKAGLYTGQLRGTFECRVDLGPLSTEAMAQDREAVAEGLLSAETAMARNGVDDVDAELAKIAARPASQLDLLSKQAAIIMDFGAAGVDVVSAARLIGMTDNQIAILEAAKKEAEEKEIEEFERFQSAAGGEEGEPGDNGKPAPGKKPAPAKAPAAAQ